MKKWYIALAISGIALLILPLVALADSGFSLYFYQFDLNPGYSAKGDKNVNTVSAKQELNLYVDASDGRNAEISYVNLTANKKMLFGIMQKQTEVIIYSPTAGESETKSASLATGEYEYVTKTYGDHVKGGINVRYNYWKD